MTTSAAFAAASLVQFTGATFAGVEYSITAPHNATTTIIGNKRSNSMRYETTNW